MLKYNGTPDFSHQSISLQIAFLRRSCQAGRIPSRAQSGGQIQAGGGPRFGKAQQARGESRLRPSEPPLTRALTFSRPSSLLLLLHHLLLCLLLLCPSIPQSYKKAIDEVSYSYAPPPCCMPVSHLGLWRSLCLSA